MFQFLIGMAMAMLRGVLVRGRLLHSLLLCCVLQLLPALVLLLRGFVRLRWRCFVQL